MPFKHYLTSVSSALKAGNATEHTYRPALKTLIESLATGVTATNEPKRVACGAPDFIVTKGPIPIGYVEAKDVGKSLDEIEEDEQLKRYRASLHNLILTDYLEFRYFRNGEPVTSARIAHVQKNGVIKSDPEGIAQTAQLFSGFFQAEVEAVGTPRELAQKMAAMARMIRELIAKAFTAEAPSGDLHSQYEGFKQVLIADLTPPQFAGMYAQTICYGLFAARCNHIGSGFTREVAARELPKTNPFLRKVFQQIAGIELDDRIAWAVDDLALLLARADMNSILENFGKHTQQEDPVVHFYETFLTAYDPKLREMRGVYYTPEPVVSYIVRSVDAILKSDFGLKDGFADASKVKVKFGTGKKQIKGGKEVEIRAEREVHRVQILDPATGTGTFLYFVINQIRQHFTGNAGMWPGYVAEHLLPRLYGFELLMAPYAVAHMKLDLQLKGSGYDFASEERLRVYLTNTLEEPHELVGLPLFAKMIAEEAVSAGEVKKDAPIMVVLGNPPYSGHSANTGDWIRNLLRGHDIMTAQKTGNYFEVNGQSLGERNPKWLNDDYVKFIRFAQWRIEQTGYGILAFITNHGYLDNATFRGMRESLMQTFDGIYVIDLHGNSKKKEVAPDGSKDENVFDIQQGVAIGLFVKSPKKGGAVAVRHVELWGLRDKKYSWLLEHDLHSTEWKNLTPQGPTYLFVSKDTELQDEYGQGWRITDAMPLNSLGIATARDDFTIRFEENRIWEVIGDFAQLDPEIAREKYSLGKDVRDWKVSLAQKDVIRSGPDRRHLTRIIYRPFDYRFTYYTGHSRGFHCMPRNEVMRHVVHKANMCLATTRQVEIGRGWEHAFCCRDLMQLHTVSIKEVNYLFPLYLYPTEKADLFDNAESSGSPSGRRPNLAAEFVDSFSKKLKLRFVSDGLGDLKSTFGPEDVFNYAYAVLYSPTYRVRYAQFLKIDFPRLPLTSDTKLFSTLCANGRRLVALHLMEEFGKEISRFPIAGSNEVVKVDFVTDSDRLTGQNSPGSPDIGRIYINAEQYFEGVPTQVWSFHIGGYQVCQKWLKDHKGRLLTFDELVHYQRVISAINETIRLQTEIDAAIPSWPIK